MRSLWLCAGLALALGTPARADEPKKADLKTYEVPYRLTKTQHVLVRAKINGKGPFNFILDTGAPALFVATKAAKKAGVEPDKKGWGAFDKFEIEGGVPVSGAKGRIEDPFQLEGMNGLGLAGAELHGMMGYNLLARYRIEIDLTKDKMTWTELDFDPPPPKGLEGAKGGLPEMDALGAVMKMFGGLLGRRAGPEVVARGFLGLELAESDGKVTVKTVLEKGPAAKAGVRAGDQVAEYNGQKIANDSGLLRLAAQLTAGKEVKLTVVRGGKRQEITVKAGEGLNMTRFTRALLLILLAALPVRADERAKEKPKDEKPVVVPFELLKTKHITLDVKVNGKGPYRVIFDTGAPMTVLNSKLAKEAGLPKGGGLFGGRPAEVKTLEVGGLKAEKLPVIIMDHPLVELMSKEKDIGPLYGIVGFPFFARYKLTIDYKAKQMTFTPNGFDPPDVLKEMEAAIEGLLSGKAAPQVLAPAAQWGLVAEKAKDDEDAGVTLKEVLAGGAAAAAGLKAGDRLLTLDGRWTDSLPDLYAAAGYVKAGTAVKVVVTRGKKEMTFTVKPTAGL